MPNNEKPFPYTNASSIPISPVSSHLFLAANGPMAAPPGMRQAIARGECRRLPDSPHGIEKRAVPKRHKCSTMEQFHRSIFERCCAEQTVSATVTGTGVVCVDADQIRG